MKKKVSVVQIPAISKYSLRDKRKNYSENLLPSGYLKSLAHKGGLLNQLDMEIFSWDVLDLAGDKFLFDKLLKFSPGFLIFPALMDNYSRSIYLAKKMKEINANLKVIASGPEISINTLKFLANSLIDFGASFLFNEQSFTLFWKSVFRGFQGFENIKGIFFRKGHSGEIFFTQPDLRINDIMGIPSPYLLGFLKPAERVFLESKRGCHYNCIYCAPAGKVVGPCAYRDMGEIKEELFFFKKYNVRSISWVDFTFNFPNEWFEKVIRTILKVNKDRELSFEASVRADLITPEQAKVLRECNFYNLGIGLQTVNCDVLNGNKRDMVLKSWLRGVNLLRQYGIGMTIDIIIGLLGENLASFKKTVDFLVENQLTSYAECFILMVDPSSSFWQKALSIDTEFQKHPPHLLLNSPLFSFNEIKEGLDYAQQKGCKMILEPLLPDTHPQLVTGASSGKSNFIWESGENLEDKDLPLTRIIMDLDCNMSSKRLYSLARLWSNYLANAMVIWFKGEDLSKGVKLMKDILKFLSLPNPYTVWNIVLESKKPVDRSFVVDKVESAIIYRPHNLDYRGIYFAETADKEYYRCATRFYLIYQYGQKGSSIIKESIKYHFYCSLKLDRVEGIEKKLKGLMAEDCEGCLLDFDSSFNSTKILQIMSFIKANNWKKKIILFKDWYLQCLWDLKFDGKYEIKGQEEQILYLTLNSEMLKVSFNNGFSVPN